MDYMGKKNLTDVHDPYNHENGFQGGNLINYMTLSEIIYNPL